MKKAMKPRRTDLPAAQLALEQMIVDREPSVLVGDRGPRERIAPDRSEIVGSKGSVFYRAHSYHTKVPVEGLTMLIEHYTDPGDVVVDPFCGSGQTGVAAILSGRRAVISDLSPAAVHIARGYTAAIDPAMVTIGTAKVLETLSELEIDLYGVSNERIEYTVWSDVYACPMCGTEILFWEAGFDRDAGTVVTEISCPVGHGPFNKNKLTWIRTTPVQENLSEVGRRQRSVRDLSSIGQEPESFTASPDWWYPTAPWESWREMWRGQHRRLGIDTASDFYTPRNLYVLAALWHEINALDDDNIKQALRFVFTAIVNRASRRYQFHPSRPTNVLSSTMYVAALNYEFNVFSLFRRKAATITKLYEHTWQAPGSCEVIEGSATELSWVPARSVDYVFADPPFGSNIFYSDSSFLWEAWLGSHTDVAAEAVVNKRVGAERGGKGLAGYEDLMRRSMSEISRVLRPNAWASLQFHNSGRRGVVGHPAGNRRRRFRGRSCRRDGQGSSVIQRTPTCGQGRAGSQL